MRITITIETDRPRYDDPPRWALPHPDRDELERGTKWNWPEPEPMDPELVKRMAEYFRNTLLALTHPQT
jgi:hypothetical protein